MGMFCLFTGFQNCFMFSKTRRTKKTGFVSFFFFLNVKNTKFKEEFSENTFLVFFVLSKTVLKNNFKKQAQTDTMLSL